MLVEAERSGSHVDDRNVKIFSVERYTLYAQGLPLLVVLITMAVDSKRPDSPDDTFDDTSFPNMGIYSCSLGNKKTADPPSYFETAHFLYFQLYVILILVTNLILFGITYIRIHAMFKNKKELDKAQEKFDVSNFDLNFQEFKMCLYFLFISGEKTTTFTFLIFNYQEFCGCLISSPPS